jgi:ankyrin repeat protein
MKRLVCLLLIGVVLPFLLHADTGVLDAIRRGDTSALKSALASSVDPNTKDDTGATALMYAAAYASAPDVRLLLEAGADVNAANLFGSPP